MFSLATCIAQFALAMVKLTDHRLINLFLLGEFLLQGVVLLLLLFHLVEDGGDVALHLL